MKPTGLVADAIRDVTRHGDLVLDLFLGSGTTLMAATRRGVRGRRRRDRPRPSTW
ncbi:DNA methyltransferase [Defluviimonas sp. SAOS-178_SWC]|uniref:DNA methyltransferase n=1 Tax=Defluviimonas sp. SAOS-178_SWC TaxID=3121287 RepID=UPI003221E692